MIKYIYTYKKIFKIEYIFYVNHFEDQKTSFMFSNIKTYRLYNTSLLLFEKVKRWQFFTADFTV